MPVIRKNARWLLPAFVFMICALIFFASTPGRAVLASGTTRQLPIYSVQKDDKVVALTFDAAWGNEDTNDLIDILDRYDIKATFFVVGQWVDKYPESVLALHNAGHEIMNHSDTHPHMTQLSADDMIKQVEGCSSKIEKVTGVKPNLFRPPYGDYNDSVISTLKNAGYYTIQWDVDSLDWKELSAEQITKRVLDKTQPGSIVLFHNAALHTPEALPMILESLKAKDIQLVKISELIYYDNYNIDHTGQQYIITSPESEDATGTFSGENADSSDTADTESAVTMDIRRQMALLE